jgi:hypothetical protein
LRRFRQAFLKKTSSKARKWHFTPSVHALLTAHGMADQSSIQQQQRAQAKQQQQKQQQRRQAGGKA